MPTRLSIRLAAIFVMRQVVISLTLESGADLTMHPAVFLKQYLAQPAVGGARSVFASS